MFNPDIPKKYRPKGYDVLYEDRDLIIGSKAENVLTVAALWEKENTIQNILNHYVRKGSAHSKKSVWVVHRLDQATTGVLIFAKSKEVQAFLKDDWKNTQKIYYAIVHGAMPKKSGLISSYLSEDEDYVVHSSNVKDEGKLAQTEYTVVHTTSTMSVLKINLLTGKKNQIRVHLADQGCPIVGDAKYGKDDPEKSKHLMLHAFSIEFTHPFSGKRVRVQADVPEHFKKLIDYKY